MSSPCCQKAGLAACPTETLCAFFQFFTQLSHTHTHTVLKCKYNFTIRVKLKIFALVVLIRRFSSVQPCDVYNKINNIKTFCNMKNMILVFVLSLCVFSVLAQNRHAFVGAGLILPNVTGLTLGYGPISITASGPSDGFALKPLRTFVSLELNNPAWYLPAGLGVTGGGTANFATGSKPEFGVWASTRWATQSYEEEFDLQLVFEAGIGIAKTGLEPAYKAGYRAFWGESQQWGLRANIGRVPGAESPWKGKLHPNFLEVMFLLKF